MVLAVSQFANKLRQGTSRPRIDKAMIGDRDLKPLFDLQKESQRHHRTEADVIEILIRSEVLKTTYT
jgi:hypothetical protein